MMTQDGMVVVGKLWYESVWDVILQFVIKYDEIRWYCSVWSGLGCDGWYAVVCDQMVQNGMWWYRVAGMVLN